VVEDAPAVALRARDAGFVVVGVTTTYRADDWPPGIVTTDSLDPARMLELFPQLRLENCT
jgi:beta-phosphoglucomutase-like phosphatase (HAD superfamily)